MIPLTLGIIAINVLALVAIALVKDNGAKKATILAAAASFGMSVFMVAQFIRGFGSAVATYWYVPYLNLSLSFGLTGASAVLLIMAEIVLLITAVSGNTENKSWRLSGAMVTLFQIAAVGLFTSLNLLMFFIFWDVGVIALFIMINTLGSENRRSASINFLLYEIFASSLLLLAIILLYVYTPAHSLNISYLYTAVGSLPGKVQLAVFASLFIAFMTNMPIFPMHFWLPDAHTEASTQGSMLLSGILTKFGGFGMVLLFGMSSIAIAHSNYIAMLSIFSAIYGALLLTRQKDMKRIVAYSTIVEMSIIMLAISSANSIGSIGAVYGMLSHGITVALAFLAVGVIKHLFNERNITVLKGIAENAKASTYAFVVAALSMVGFPLTSGFMADIMIFFGAVQSFGLMALLPLIAILLMGAYLYSLISKSFLSKGMVSPSSGTESVRQRIGYMVIAAIVFVFGIMPFLVLALLKV